MSRRVSDSRKLIEVVRIIALEGPLTISELTKKLSGRLNMHYRTARSAIGRLLPSLLRKGAVAELDRVGPRGTRFIDITPKGCEAALFAGILDYVKTAEAVFKHVNEFKRPLAKAIGYVHKEVLGVHEEELSEEEAVGELFEQLDRLEESTWDEVLESTLTDPLVYHSHWEEFEISRSLLEGMFDAYNRAPRDLKPYILQVLEYVANMKEARGKQLEEEAKQYFTSANQIRQFVEKERRELFKRL